MEAKVGVKVSDGKNEARASLRLRLNYVTDKMLQNSVTLRVKNVTAEAFLVPFYEYLLEGLAFVIPTPKTNIPELHDFNTNIFGLHDFNTNTNTKTFIFEKPIPT